MSIREKGYKINVPEKCPNTLNEALKMLGNVKYVAWGFPMVFIYKDQSKLTEGWSVSFRNAARIEKQPDTKSKTPLGACKKMHKFLLKLKKNGVRI